MLILCSNRTAMKLREKLKRLPIVVLVSLFLYMVLISLYYEHNLSVHKLRLYTEDLVSEICDKPWRPKENTDEFQSVLSDRCTFMRQVIPKVVPNGAFSFGRKLEDEAVEEENRRSVRMCLKSLITFGLHSNGWSFKTDTKFRQWMDSMNKLYVLLESWSDSHYELQKQHLRKATARVHQWLDSLGAYWSQGFCNSSTTLGECPTVKDGFFRNLAIFIMCYKRFISHNIVPVDEWPDDEFNRTGLFEPLPKARPKSNCNHLKKHPSNVFYDNKIHLASDNPLAWYLAALKNFLFQPTEYLETLFLHHARRIGFHPHNDPVACAHIRRGDKLERTPVQPLEKYLLLIHEFFNRCDLKKGSPCARKIFLAVASGNEELIEARKKLPANYEVMRLPLTDLESAKERDAWNVTADDLMENKMLQMMAFKSFYDMTPVRESILLDGMFLGEADFLVGTTSSHVTSIAQVVRASTDPRASETFHSLDWSWSEVKQIKSCLFRAISDHNLPGELQFKKGDLIRLWGFSKPLYSKVLPTKGVAWGCKAEADQGECIKNDDEGGWVPEFKLRRDKLQYHIIKGYGL